MPIFKHALAVGDSIQVEIVDEHGCKRHLAVGVATDSTGGVYIDLSGIDCHLSGEAPGMYYPEDERCEDRGWLIAATAFGHPLNARSDRMPLTETERRHLAYGVKVHRLTGQIVGGGTGDTGSAHGPREIREVTS